MQLYGLHPSTLKGELFKILLEQGNNGLKVSDLAKSLPVSFYTFHFLSRQQSEPSSRYSLWPNDNSTHQQYILFLS